MKTALELMAVIREIAHPCLTFRYGETNGVPWLRVECEDGACNVTGAPMSWTGRKWMLSFHMTTGEIVQTAFKALLTALEHEARESFTYAGVSVFAPHYDIEKLVELRQQPDALEEREPA